MTDDEIIHEMSAQTPVSCSCSKCVDMCKRAVCLGTPQDILNLINNGYTGILEGKIWNAGQKYNLPSIPMIQVAWDYEKEQCIMLDDDGKCKLHAIGLKPTEGRFSDCQVTELPPGKIPSGYVIALMWTSYYKRDKTISLIERALEK